MAEMSDDQLIQQWLGMVSARGTRCCLCPPVPAARNHTRELPFVCERERVCLSREFRLRVAPSLLAGTVSSWRAVCTVFTEHQQGRRRGRAVDEAGARTVRWTYVVCACCTCRARLGPFAVTASSLLHPSSLWLLLLTLAAPAHWRRTACFSFGHPRLRRTTM